MTVISNPEFEQSIVRHDTGQFGVKPHSAPDTELNPRAELDEANERIWANSEALLEEIGDYLVHGMPATADRVEFEPSDQGDYLRVARAFDANDVEIETEEEDVRWAQVDDIVSNLGHPDDNAEIKNLLDTTNGRDFTWKRTSPTDPPAEAKIRDRITALMAERRALKRGSQQAAIVTARRMIPEGSRLVMGWSDQGEWLSFEKVILADGTELGYDEAFDAGIDSDELETVCSDILDAGDPALRQLDDRGNFFELTQQE